MKLYFWCNISLLFCFAYENLFLAILHIFEPPRDKTNKMTCPPSLIRVFAVRMKKAWVLSYPLSAKRRLWTDWADAQADLSLRWPHSHFVGFVMRRLICQDCKSAKTVKNGVVTFGNFTTYGELAKVTCDFGYQLKGHPYLVCQSDGKWTTNTTCEKVGKSHFESILFIDNNWSQRLDSRAWLFSLKVTCFIYRKR